MNPSPSSLGCACHIEAAVDFILPFISIMSPELSPSAVLDLASTLAIPLPESVTRASATVNSMEVIKDTVLIHKAGKRYKGSLAIFKCKIGSNLLI
jgi:hypothetical protein